MQRWLVPFFVITSLSGCIIYENETSDSCDEDSCDTLESSDSWGSTEGTTDIAPEAPLPTCHLSDTSGLPGETLLCWIECPDSDFDYTEISSVLIFGDVQPSDLVLRPEEAFLLLEVDDDATPGQVEILLELTNGGAVLLEGGFTVLDPDAESTGSEEEPPYANCAEGGESDTGVGPC